MLLHTTCESKENGESRIRTHETLNTAYAISSLQIFVLTCPRVSEN